MLDRAAQFMDSYDQVMLTDIEARLAFRCGSVPVRLTDSDISGYIDRPYVAGWRVPVVFEDNSTRRIDVLLSPWFPDIAARTALVDHPGRLTWPHVETDGVLCLLSNSHDMDLDDPVNVIDNLMARSCDLIGRLIEGAIIERDFKQEFLTYWNYDLNDTRRIHSLVEPRGPTREIFAWHGRSMSVVAETEEALQTWLRHRFEGISEKQLGCEKACFVWLDSPPVPSEYPQDGSGLLELVARAGPAGLQLLEARGNRAHSSVTVIFGAEGRGGPGLIAVRALGSTGRDNVRSRERGFRRNRVPDQIALNRLLPTSIILRSKVLRADAPWIHGRGRDARSGQLASASAVVFGCGSVGSTVALTLLRAGVGHLTVVDNDELEWPNVSRHELGGSAVGVKKSLELARRLQRDFPHATIVGSDQTVQGAIAEEFDWLANADLIVSATGSGQADRTLNRWHKSNGRKVPIVYGWAEPYGIAGHAVAVAESGGCLEAGVDRVGLSKFELTRFEETAALEEPACGMHYTPYGAVELAFINTVVAELAVDCALGRVVSSTHRMWAGRHDLLLENGGRWTSDALDLMNGEIEGGRLLSRPWRACTCCQSDQTSKSITS
ncbi:ThiF family adenylyltransferase [Rhizobium leguminosarum]|uniref:ThiF family adenylyltransferase n=1 Tax=Rhizobium leguminosarum TaxID=384 RepID=UPI001032586F|nr:ThiF family adenylyltransferase [Rhizobium leguminosarum]TAY98660.1 ubiquitin-activating enzyme [Rhizobium leguminosarum]TAZ09425.1 ubiquitin-activating enzyme [Rhizobium leguminosarum]